MRSDTLSRESSRLVCCWEQSCGSYEAMPSHDVASPTCPSVLNEKQTAGQPHPTIKPALATLAITNHNQQTTTTQGEQQQSEQTQGEHTQGRTGLAFAMANARSVRLGVCIDLVVSVATFAEACRSKASPGPNLGACASLYSAWQHARSFEIVPGQIL